jgi:hypothetical protein
VRLDKVRGVIFLEMYGLRLTARHDALDPAELANCHTDANEQKPADRGNRTGGQDPGIKRSVARDRTHRDEG